MNDKMKEAVRKTIEEWKQKQKEKELGDEEFIKWVLEDYDDSIKRDILGGEMRCDPDTCDGECQGMGWCKVAKKFREGEHD